MTLSAGSRLGPYEITSAIGAGGMGEVFRARDTKLNREVAIKVLPAAFAQDHERVARFKREAQVLASLNHPSIAAIYGLEESAGVVALVLELVEGEDLSQRLKRGALPVDEAIAIAKQIAEALEEAHERGIVHRDLKPANVKVTPDGKVKVLDFGLAKAFDNEAGTGGASGEISHSPTMSRQATEAGMIMGTAAYMSPEQARGKKVDKRSDIWSFGVVLFEMLAGERLFAGETVSDVLAAVLTRNPDWKSLPATVTPNVRNLIERCLDRDPKKRLRDIGDARFALEGRAETSAAPPSATVSPSRAAAITPWLIAAIAIAGLAWRSFHPATSAELEVVHFEIAYPPNVEPVSELQGGFGLSPDGRTVGMIGVRNGIRALFLRPLDRPDAREIAGSNGANSVSFSPDSRSVALIPGSTVVTRISLDDEQRAVVATGGDLSGEVLWMQGGDILFNRGGALWAAKAAGGGEPREIVPLDKARNEVLQNAPIVPPGSTKVLFTSQSAQGGQDRIDAASLDGSGRSVVLENAGTPVWSPTGHLLFSRDGGVWAVPFDPVATAVRGAAVPVIPPGVIGNVRSSNLGYQVSTNGTLVFVPRNLSSKRVVMVTRDGSEKALDLPRDSYGNPRVSPDGRTLLLGVGGLVMEAMDLQRGTRAKVTSAAPGTSFPTWTSDGRSVAFRRFNLPIWAATDGSGRSGAIESGVINDYPTSPGPDPDSILAVRINPKTSGDIYLLSTSGRFPPKVLIEGPGYEGSPQLSPDKRFLVYQSNESGQAEVYVRRYPALDRQWQISEGGGIQTRWSRSGREIFYRNGHSMMAVAFGGASEAPSLGKPAVLFTDDYDFGQGLSIPNYDVMEDGRFVMFRRDSNGGRLRAVLNWTEELKRIIAAGGVK